MQNLDNLSFQKLDQQGVHTLIAWAQAEGWNPGPYDAEVFWETDPDGFYGIYLDHVLIGGGAIVSYNRAFGFMGLFIVQPEYRGQGIGEKLWYLRRDTLLQRLNDDAPVGMDGVVAMQPFYQKGGFEIAFKDERYEKMGIALDVDARITTVTTADFDNILAYDTQCFGFPRPQFLKPWLNKPTHKVFRYTANNELKGFAVLRKVTRGFKIGPLFADAADVAEALYRGCLNAAQGENIYLDIPMSNQGAIDMVKKYEAKYIFECARMYYGKPPKTNMDKVYGITTFELG